MGDRMGDGWIAREGQNLMPLLAPLQQMEDGPWASFTPLRSNLEAFDAAMLFAQGRMRYVLLVGPSGWGKTHLVKAAAEAARIHGQEGVVLSTQEFLASPSAVNDPRHYLIDNAQDVRRKPRDRQNLRWMVERRLQFRRPTLLCFDENHSGGLIHQFSALSHGTCVARIFNPGAEEKELLVRQAAERMGLDIHRSIARLIARRQAGNAHSISGALNRLSLGRGPWNSEGSLARACGLIFPTAVGSDGWDLRDLAADAVEAAFDGFNAQENERDRCLCWLLRRVIGLQENRVAEYLRMAPGAIYRLTTSVETSGFDEVTGQRATRARKVLLQLLSE